MIKKPLAISELPAMHEPLPLLTTTELGKILRIPPMRIARAIRRGQLHADFITRTLNLFRPASVPKIGELLGLN